MSRIKQVTIVTETFYPDINGVSNTLFFLVEGLEKQGINVQVIRPRQRHQDTCKKTLRYTDITLPGLPIPGYQQLTFGLPFGRRIKNALCQFNTDAVYIATEGPLGLSALRAAKKLGLPVLSGFHTNFHQYFEHYHLAFLKKLVFKYLRAFHNATARTLVPTQFLQSELVRQGFQHVHIMARGVDNALFSPNKRSEQIRRSWEAEPSDPVLLYVGRIASEKNIHLALQGFEAFQRIKPRAKMVLVGDGPLRSSLVTEFPNVIFAGEKRGESLAQYYASADIFLFPSLTDTFGNVVLEAMASRLHVLAFDYAAAGTFIQHGRNGSLAKYQDTLDFLDQIKQLALTWEENSNEREQAHITVEKMSWQSISEAFAQHLHIIKERGSYVSN